MKLALVFLLVCVTTVVLAKKKNKPTRPPPDEAPAQPKDGDESFDKIDPTAKPITRMCTSR